MILGTTIPAVCDNSQCCSDSNECVADCNMPDSIRYSQGKNLFLKIISTDFYKVNDYQ